MVHSGGCGRRGLGKIDAIEERVGIEEGSFVSHSMCSGRGPRASVTVAHNSDSGRRGWRMDNCGAGGRGREHYSSVSRRAEQGGPGSCDSCLHASPALPMSDAETQRMWPPTTAMPWLSSTTPGHTKLK